MFQEYVKFVISTYSYSVEILDMKNMGHWGPFIVQSRFDRFGPDMLLNLVTAAACSVTPGRIVGDPFPGELEAQTLIIFK